MEQFDPIVHQLTAWAEQQQLTQQALRCCRTAIATCAQDDIAAGIPPLKGWPSEAIQIHFTRHALIFQTENAPYPFIETCLELWIADTTGSHWMDRHIVGRYRLITTLNGEIADDYLEFI